MRLGPQGPWSRTCYTSRADSSSKQAISITRCGKLFWGFLFPVWTWCSMNTHCFSTKGDKVQLLQIVEDSGRTTKSSPLLPWQQETSKNAWTKNSTLRQTKICQLNLIPSSESVANSPSHELRQMNLWHRVISPLHSPRWCQKHVMGYALCMARKTLIQPFHIWSCSVYQRHISV